MLSDRFSYGFNMKSMKFQGFGHLQKQKQILNLFIHKEITGKVFRKVIV